MIVIVIVVLIVLEICCNVFIIVVLLGYNFGGNWFNLFVCVGIMIIEILIINIEWSMMMVNVDVLIFIFVKKNSVIIVMINFGIISVCGLYVLNKWLVNGDIKLFSILFGSNINFVENVVSVKLFCKYSGSKIIVERIIIKLINIKISFNVNIGYLNIFKFIKGFFIVSWC